MLTFLLFRLCSQVLQEYVAKESGLLDLKTEKLELTQGVPSNQMRASNNSFSMRSQKSNQSHNEEDVSTDQISSAANAIKSAKSGSAADIGQLEISEGILVQ